MEPRRLDWERLAAAAAVLTVFTTFVVWVHNRLTIPFWSYLVRSGLRAELDQIARHDRELKNHTEMLGAAVYAIGQLTTLANTTADGLNKLATLPHAIEGLSANVGKQSDILEKLSGDVAFLKGARDEAGRFSHDQ